MDRGWNALTMSRQVTSCTCRVVSGNYPVVNQKINPQLFCFFPMYEPQIVTQNGTQYVSKIFVIGGGFPDRIKSP
jgi:hypothetical protein